MTLPITQRGSLIGSAAATAAMSGPGSGARTGSGGQAASDSPRSQAVAAALNGSSGSTKPTLHVRGGTEASLTRIHVSQPFTRGALRGAFKKAVDVAMSVFFRLGDDGEMESNLLSGNDPEQFLSLNGKERNELLDKVRTALDEGRFDEAGDLLKDSMDLFNEGNADRFRTLAQRAGREFEASLKHSLGHVRLNSGGDFSAMMNQAAEEGGKLVEDALRGSLFGGGEGLGALTRATGEAVDTLLADDRREAYTTEGRAALLKANAAEPRRTEEQAGDHEDEEELPEVTGDLFGDITALVSENTLWDSETMVALKKAAEQMAGRAESMLKEGVGSRSLSVEFDVYLEAPEKRGDGNSVLDTLLADLKDEADAETKAASEAGSGDAADSDVNPVADSAGTGETAGAGPVYNDLRGLYSREGFEALIVAVPPQGTSERLRGMPAGHNQRFEHRLTGLLRNLQV